MSFLYCNPFVNSIKMFFMSTVQFVDVIFMKKKLQNASFIWEKLEKANKNDDRF